MAPRKGQERLAIRMAVLQAEAANPGIGARGLSRLLVQGNPPLVVHESTVRSILTRFKNEDFSVSSPESHKGAGRPSPWTTRWKKCVFVDFVRI